MCDRPAVQASRVDVDSVESFYIGAGPGSFTGVRLGLSVLQAFALGRKSRNFLCVLAFSHGANRCANKNFLTLHCFGSGKPKTLYYQSVSYVDGTWRPEQNPATCVLEALPKENATYVFSGDASEKWRQARMLALGLDTAQVVFPEAKWMLRAEGGYGSLSAPVVGGFSHEF